MTWWENWNNHAERVWEHLRHQLAIFGFFSKIKSHSLGFSPKSNHILGTWNTRPVFPKGWEGMKHEISVLSGALLSHYLLYLISVLLPKCFWHQASSSLLPPPTSCSSCLSCHTWTSPVAQGWANQKRWAKSNLQRTAFTFLNSPRWSGEEGDQKTI